MPALDRDVSLIEAAVQEAGKIALSYFGNSYKKWDKGRGQPVTEADIAVDRFLKSTLIGARPDYGWLSEETEDEPLQRRREHVFVVDPIDGTVAFMKGRPHFSISVGLVREGRPVAGVVFNPATDECFSAALDGGANLNGRVIHVSHQNTIENCRMLAAKDLFDHPGWSNPPNKPWPPMHVENRNSIAYRMSLVAKGEFDAAVFFSPKHDWDMAAGDLIVREAGGCVTHHDGTIPHYNRKASLQASMVCAGKPLHALILERVRHIQLPGHQGAPENAKGK